MSYCDAHCHLANLDALLPVAPLLDEAVQHGITRFFSTALTRRETELHARWNDPRIIHGAGVHPNFDECDLTLDDVRDYCARGMIQAVGEIGYDRNGAALSEQLGLLDAQLAIARDFQLPVILHLVGLPEPVLDLLKSYSLSYLVHGFAGKTSHFEQLSRLNAWFTISERIIKPDKHELLQAMVMGGRYLFETDITRYYVLPGETNPLLRLPALVKQAAAICGMLPVDLERGQTQSFQAFTGQSLG